ncbi:MAG: hypothetical protein ACREDH_09155 [Methylocella sp.]
MKRAALGGHRDSRAAQVQSIPARHRIEWSAGIEIGTERPFARKITPVRLDRDIVEDQFSFFGEGRFMLQGNIAKFAFLILSVF